jgi:hypothetical protein
MRESQVRFIRQQGFSAPHADERLYSALMFQPRIVLCLVVLGVLLQSPWYFLALSAVLWSGALVPTHNLFNAIYNRLIALPRGLPPLGVAPGPRRIGQGMAGTLALAIGGALLSGSATTARVLEGLFGGAAMVVVFGRFCAGSYLYHRLRGGSSTRRQSLPTDAQPRYR